MAVYECCGVYFGDAKDLTGHMKSQHKMADFSVDLNCCGKTFREARELIDHVSLVHHYQMQLQT